MPRILPLLLSALLVSWSGHAYAQPADTPAPAGKTPAAAPVKLELPACDEKATPEQLLEAIEKLWQTPIEAENRIDEQNQKIQVLKQIIAGADLVLKQETAKEESVLLAVQNKMEALSILARAGDETAAASAL